MAQKPHLNIVIIGHVDHGKSTMVGRLMFETGAVPEYVIEKLRQEAQERGKAGFEFAYVMDNLKEERERGVTIDIAHKKFETDKYYFTIIDAPGHRDFVKNMITGTSQADAAVLVVSAQTGEGVMAQTKEHVFLARTLGVQQLIVLVNKMDMVSFAEKRFQEVKEEVTKLLKMVGYKPENIPVIPASGLKGHNISKKSSDIPYATQTLLDALNNVQVPPKPTDKPLRIPIQDSYSITGIGTVPVGRVETGVVKIGDTVVFQPSNAKGEVKSIEMHHEQLQTASPGDNIGFNVRGIAKNDVKRGDVCGHVDKPPRVAKTFKAQIAVLNHPSVIHAGYTPVFHVHTAQVACTIEDIEAKLDPKTGQKGAEKPDIIKTGDVAIVKVRPQRPVSIETAKEIPQMSRFAVRDMGQTVAAGLCLEIEDRTA